MKISTATIKNKPKQVSTKHGLKILVNIFLDGQEHTLWQHDGDELALSLNAGQSIQVCIDSKGKMHLVDDSLQEEGNTNRKQEIQPVGVKMLYYHAKDNGTIHCSNYKIAAGQGYVVVNCMTPANAFAVLIELKRAWFEAIYNDNFSSDDDVLSPDELGQIAEEMREDLLD